jgi:L,D-transpeptidase-like protein
VQDAVRIDNSGIFVRSAPWSVSDRGKRNVSHGCPNLSPASAQWFYDNFGSGDPWSSRTPSAPTTRTTALKTGRSNEGTPSRRLWFLPPAILQLSGQAKVLDWTDDEGRDAFRQFWIGRRILKAYEESYRSGETRICFLKITPDPVINTYMVGYNIWQLRNHMESGAAKVVDPRGDP